MEGIKEMKEEERGGDYEREGEEPVGLEEEEDDEGEGRVMGKEGEFIALTIDIAPGETEELTIHKDAQAEKVAYDFCLKHGLDFDCLQPLSEHIKATLTINTKATSQKLEDLPESPLVSPNVVNPSSNQVPQPQKSKGNTMTVTSTNKKRSNDNEYLPTTSSSKSRLFLYESINTNKQPIKPSKTSKSRQCKSYHKKPTNKPNDGNTPNNHAYLSPTVNSVLKTENASTPNDEILQKLLTSNTNTMSNTINNPFKSLNKHLPNYGERLYHKGRKHQEITKEKLNRLKTTLTLPQKQNATFKPKINDISYKTLSNRYYNKQIYDNEDIIINYKDYFNSKLANLRSKHAPTDTYTFTPAIDKHSLMIEDAKHSKDLPNRFESLYENHKKQQMNLERLTNQYYDKTVLFKPEINSGYSSSITALPFEERSQHFLAKANEKHQIAKGQCEALTDQETGQAFFHPQINCNYQRAENAQLNIYDNLYNDHAKMQFKKTEKDKMSGMQIKTAQNLTFVMKESHEMYERRKEKIFRNLFGILDSDQDGMITKRYMDVKALPKNIQRILAPIIEELNEENETLTENEFSTACFHLFDMISYWEKDEMMRFDKEMRKEDKKSNGGIVIGKKEMEKMKERNALLYHLSKEQEHDHDHDEHEEDAENYMTEENEEHQVHTENSPIIENEINSTDQ